jgi:hypothetical protein
MSNTIKLFASVAFVAASVSSAFAASVPAQDREAWFTDSGRYIDGQTPPVPYYRGRHVVAQAPMFEGRNSAVINGSSFANDPTFSQPTGRDAMVQELGN